MLSANDVSYPVISKLPVLVKLLLPEFIEKNQILYFHQMVQKCVWKVPVGGSCSPEQDTKHKIGVYGVCSVLFCYVNVPKHDRC